MQQSCRCHNMYRCNSVNAQLFPCNSVNAYILEFVFVLDKVIRRGKPFIRHSVRHSSKENTTYSDAISRRFILRYTVLYLLLGGSFNADGNMAFDEASTEYKIPNEYLHVFLGKYPNENGLAWLSKLLEFKYHPTNLRFADSAHKVQSFDKGKLNHNVSFVIGQCIVYPMQTFREIMDTNKLVVSEVTFMRRAKKISWFHSGRRYEAKS
eukprot:882794_1